MFDLQDLEHQVLFRMTTYDGKESFKIIDDIIDEQLYIIKERMSYALVKPDKLFQMGFKRTNNNNWKLVWENGKKHLFAVHKNKNKRKVIFKWVENSEKIILDKIIEDYHYIHCSRNKGWTVGLFFEGSDYPFAIEQVEPSSVSRNYKRAILNLLEIDTDKCAEITRFYTIPNTPKMIVGIRDKITEKILKENNYCWQYTSVMPTFAKGESTTTAGGMNIPIFAKELTIQFYKRQDGKYQFCTNRKKEQLRVETIKNKWELAPVIEMLKPLHPKLRIKLNKLNQIYYVKEN